jgi:hypothetical protein
MPSDAGFESLIEAIALDKPIIPAMAQLGSTTMIGTAPTYSS